MTLPNGIAADLAALEEDVSLLAPDAFAARARAHETLETDIVGPIAALGERGADARSLRALRRRAEALEGRLARADARLFVRLRDGIRRGELRGDVLVGKLQRLAPPSHGPDDGGYDALDALVSGILLDEPPPPTVRSELRGWDPEMVPYQPTPARIVLELAAHLRPGEEVFYDLGSGPGQVCALVRLLTGARTVGIEIDPMLWAYSERLAQRLGLSGVMFAVGDVRDVDLTPGTFFYLYTPFGGALLEAVLDRLCRVAASHPIRLGSYGPCTAVIGRQAWLLRQGPAHDDPDRLAVFGSV